MSRNGGTYLQLLTYCMLISFAYGLIGKSVRNVRANKYPFVVSIGHRTQNPKDFINLHFCTGTLIKERSVMTAAHCLINKNPNTVEIIAGNMNIQHGHRYFPESFVTYDQWTGKHKGEYSLHDIAVIILEGAGIPHINPAPVLTVDNKYLDKKNVRIIGWGNLQNGKPSNGLKTAILTVVTNDECGHQGTMLKGKKFSVPPNYFCSKANPFVVSTCGDGGAPLVNRRQQVVGINIGVCPHVEGYPQDMLNQLQMNSHLHLYYYKDFLSHVWK